MSKRAATAAERRHMERVAGLPCVLCEFVGQLQTTPTTVHHIRTGQGGAQRASHFLTVALCADCHQNDPMGIHGDQTLLRIAKVNELDLLAETYRRLEDSAA